MIVRSCRSANQHALDMLLRMSPSPVLQQPIAKLHEAAASPSGTLEPLRTAEAGAGLEHSLLDRHGVAGRVRPEQCFLSIPFSCVLVMKAPCASLLVSHGAC